MTRLEALHCDVFPPALLPLRENATLQRIEAEACPGEDSQGVRPVADSWRAYDAWKAKQPKRGRLAFPPCSAIPPHMKAKIRELLHATPFQPCVIRMADGREYRIDHPDFVLAASTDVPQITIEDPDGSTHFLSSLLVTSVERVSAAVHSQAA